MRNYMYKKKSINYAKVIVLVLCLILLLLLTWALTSQKSQEMTQGKQYEESSDEPRKQKIIEAKKNPPRSFTLTGLGDVMCHNTQFKDAYVSTSGVYDFNYVFDDLEEYLVENNIVYTEAFFAPTAFLKKGFDYSRQWQSS